MVELEKFGATKRFGARYGRSIKHAFGKIEKEQRKLHKCPYCNRVSVKRIAVGIWNCRKCGAKFTGKAYSVREIIKGREEKESREESPKEKIKEEEAVQNG
jgi:large subunit ribosomal protein L37Ae